MAVTEVQQAFSQWQTIFIASAILLFVYVCAFYRTVKTWYGDVPGPTPLPILGQLLDLLRHKGQMHLQNDEYYRKYGKVFRAAMSGRIPSLIVADPEMLKDIFVKEFDCFSDRPVSFSLRLRHLYNYFCSQCNKKTGQDRGLITGAKMQTVDHRLFK